MSDAGIGKLFSVKVRVTVGLVITAIGIALISAFIAAPHLTAQLTYTASVIGGAAAVYAAFYAAAALHVSVRRDRQGRAFALLAALNQEEATKVQAICDKVIGTTALSPAQIVEAIKGDHELDHAIKYVLGHFEDISIAIQEDHAEERVVFRSLQRLVPLYWTKLGEYIKQQRQLTGSELLYCEFESLAKAWEAGRSIRTGENLPRRGCIT